MRCSDIPENLGFPVRNLVICARFSCRAWYFGSTGRPPALPPALPPASPPARCKRRTNLSSPYRRHELLTATSRGRLPPPHTSSPVSHPPSPPRSAVDAAGSRVCGDDRTCEDDCTCDAPAACGRRGSAVALTGRPRAAKPSTACGGRAYPKPAAAPTAACTAVKTENRPYLLCHLVQPPLPRHHTQRARLPQRFRSA